MRRALVIAALILVVVLSVPAAAVYWLCYTESGLQWLATRSQGLKAARVSFDGLEGRLAGPISVRRFELEHPRVHIVARDIRATLSLRALLLQTVQVETLEAGSIDVEVRRRSPAAAKRPLRFLPAWLRLRVQPFEIPRAQLRLPNGMEFAVAPLRATATLTTGRLDVQDAVAQTEYYRLAGNLRVFAADPIGLGGEFDWLFQPPDQPRIAGRVVLDGNLARLAVNGTVSGPFAATVHGSAQNLTGEWRWTAESRVERFDLRPWQAQSRLGSFRAALRGTGNREGFELAGTIEPQTSGPGNADVSLRGAFAQRRLRVDELIVKLLRPGSELRGRGELIFDGGLPTSRLEGRWSNLRWPLDRDAVVRSREGTFSLAGAMPYSFTAAGDITAPRVTEARAAIRGVLARDRVLVESLEARLLDGTLRADGELAWSGDKQWNVQLQAQNLATAAFHEAFPGHVGFQLTGSGRGFDPEGTWQLALDDLRGQIRSHALAGKTRVRHEGRSFRVTDTDIRYGGARLLAQGTYGPRRDLHVELTAEDLARVLPEARGRVQLLADLAGDEREPQLMLSLRAASIEYQRFRLGNLQADADVDLSDANPSTLRIEASGLGIEDRRLRILRVTVDGRASAHDLAMRADAGNVQVDLHARADYQNMQWHGVLDRLAIVTGETRVALAAPTELVLSPHRAEIGSFCLSGVKERACGQAQWQEHGPWMLQAQAENVPLRLLAAGLPRPSEYSGLLALEARAQGAPGSRWTGELRANFSDGVFRYKRANGKVQSLEIGTGRAQLAAEPETFLANVTLRAASAATLRAEVRARRQRGTNWRALPISGSLDAQTSELGFVPVLVPEIDRAAGELRADLTLSGTLGKPRFDGALELIEGELDLYAVNLLLRGVGLKVDFDANRLALAGQFRAGAGSAQIKGELAWNEAKPRGTLAFSGENLVLLDVPEARVVASPNLRFRVNGRRIEVDGAVRVPQARLAPANLTGAVLPSEDETLLGREPESPENRLVVTTGVHLILGQDVHIESYGLTGKLIGGVLVYSASGEVSTGIGEIKIEEGKYVYYGRELQIDRGRLIFTGGPLGDPGVDIRAVKRFPEMLAGVNVRGTLRAPRVSFFSDPPLPQTQIVSMLISGGTLDALQSDTAQGTGQTREQLLAQGGALLASRLGEQLGLEEVSVESDRDNETSLVLGKYLSPRLYVSYGISLTESINTLKLRYTLDDRWTIKTEAGENRSADLVFSIER